MAPPGVHGEDVRDTDGCALDTAFPGNSRDTNAGSHTDAQITPERAATTAKSLRNNRTVSGSSGRPVQAEREWFTPAEVAAKLRVSRATVYGLIGRGELPATRVGLSLRVHSRPLAAFLSR